MEFSKLQTQLRTGTGKGPARRIRRQGLVPAVVYGPGIETIKASIEPRALVQALSGPLRTNTVIELTLDKPAKDTPKEIHVLVRDHQYHPVSRQLLHVDFLAIDVNKTIVIDVPIETRGRSVGEQTGGTLTQIYRELPIECLPKDIPVSFEIEVSALDINDSLCVSDLTLPESVTCSLPPDTSIVTVVAPRAEEEEPEEDEEGLEGEGEEGAEGEEGEKKEGDDAKGDDKGGDSDGKKD